MDKKGTIGVGFLLFLVAILLISVIAAIVVIQSGGLMQEKALSTADRSKFMVATSVIIMEISATNGRDGYLTEFQMDLKTSPGSEDIKLDLGLITFSTLWDEAYLTYAGTDAAISSGASGYITNKEQELGQVFAGTGGLLLSDLDDDQLPDYYYLNTTHLHLNISSEPAPITIALNEALTGGNTLDVDSRIVGLKDYGGVVIQGTTTAAGQIDEDVVFTITPTSINTGRFVAQYLQQGVNSIPGNIQRGDVVRIYFEAPREILRKEKIRVQFIPKTGTPTVAEFHIPDVISNEREYLYPK